MDNSDQLPQSAETRLGEALDEAWRLVKSQFRDGRISIEREAPLQHRYAQILSTLGDLYATGRKESWVVDLEWLEDGLVDKGHKDYIDVVCEVYDGDELIANAAVELKFKKDNSGVPRGDVTALYDIFTLEKATDSSYDMGRFLMATNQRSYWNSPRAGTVRSRFGIYQDRKISPGTEIVAETKTASDVLKNKPVDERLQFEGAYHFTWEKLDGDDSAEFRFLSVAVD